MIVIGGQEERLCVCKDSFERVSGRLKWEGCSLLIVGRQHSGTCNLGSLSPSDQSNPRTPHTSPPLTPTKPNVARSGLSPMAARASKRETHSTTIWCPASRPANSNFTIFPTTRQHITVKMPSEVSDIKQFIEICRRKDAKCTSTNSESVRGCRNRRCTL